MLPILYSFRRCPYAIRARMAIHYARQTVELREVFLKDKPVSMLLASPKATVPVLVLPDGKVLEESIDIMHWAISLRDSDGWWREKSATLTHALTSKNILVAPTCRRRSAYAP